MRILAQAESLDLRLLVRELRELANWEFRQPVEDGWISVTHTRLSTSCSFPCGRFAVLQVKKCRIESAWGIGVEDCCEAGAEIDSAPD